MGGELLLRVNPLTAGEHYIGHIVVDGRGWSGPVVAHLAAPRCRDLDRTRTRRWRPPAGSSRGGAFRMTLRQLSASVGAFATAAIAAAPTAHAAPPTTVSVDRTTIATKLGHNFVIHSTIANHAATPATDLIAHLNVLSLRPGLYVDPGGLVVTPHPLPPADPRSRVHNPQLEARGRQRRLDLGVSYAPSSHATAAPSTPRPAPRPRAHRRPAHTQRRRHPAARARHPSATRTRNHHTESRPTPQHTRR